MLWKVCLYGPLIYKLDWKDSVVVGVALILMTEIDWACCDLDTDGMDRMTLREEGVCSQRSHLPPISSQFCPYYYCSTSIEIRTGIGADGKAAPDAEGGAAGRAGTMRRTFRSRSSGPDRPTDTRG